MFVLTVSETDHLWVGLLDIFLLLTISGGTMRVYGWS